jgi:coniferyl-aldehyde dehydrogenase
MPLSLVSDVAVSVRSLRDAARHVTRWMRPERRAVPFPLGALGCRARIEYQPKGVVGIVAPWNYPLNLAFVPLAAALAAGNRAMIKMSELVPHTSKLCHELVAGAFDPAEVAVVTGDAAVGQAFTRLPFDHLLFTGSTAVGRHVMRAAADNLVPVTLELGGKSPVIVGRSADLARVALSVAQHKLFNAGQTCLAPDYLIVPRELAGGLAARIRAAALEMYPRIAGNPDYTSIVDARHFARLEGYVTDAAARGAEVIRVGAADDPPERLAAERRMPLTLVRAWQAPLRELRVMQEEIFGPVLPMLEYDSIEEAIGWVNAGPRPLALYYFGHDAAEERRVLDRTHSGGVTVNEITWHFVAEDLPFGGVGASGFGAYHGIHGFREFSHARAVFRQGPVDVSAIAGMRPPYGARLQRTIARELKG